ncbi:hypothetical protein SteCoe_32834 [Stentor coeruleus]|uniref:Lipid-binding serum glycoprotein C-terminal domain-containing protein n=1 Tax=Stentor coeruleus TaxID=5963 RepID=A0A1R2AY36_9CILI|nr:hypothetical protein SteCoe_32834 [Stentor coeruleus]
MSALITALIFAISEQTVNNLLDDIVISLETNTQNYQIPDQSFELDLAAIVNFDFTEIYLEKLKITGYQATMISPDSIDLDIESLNLKVSFQYKYELNGLIDKGTGLLEIINTTISTTALSSSQKTVKFSPLNTKVKVHDILIEVNKPDSKNQNWVFAFLKPELKDLISDQVKSIINSGIEAIDLGDMYTSFNNSDLAFNYSLSHPLTITDQMLKGESLGIFIQESNPNYNPPIPKPVDAVITEIEGIQFVASDYVLNSLSYAAFISGLLNFTITNSNLPQDLPFGLTTTTVGLIIPELIVEYGLGKPVNFSCNFVEPPFMNFVDNNEWSAQIKALGYMECEIFVDNEVALKLGVSVIGDARLYLEEWKIKGTINELKVDKVEVISATIDVNTDDVKDFINSSLETYIKTINDNALKNGIEIPDFGKFDLKDSKVKTGTGFLYLLINPSLSFTLEDLINFLG